MHKGATNLDLVKGSGKGGHRRDSRNDRPMTGPGRGGRREYQNYHHEDVHSDGGWSGDGAWNTGAWKKWERGGFDEGGWAPPPAPASQNGDLERRIETMSQEFTDNLRRLGEKGNEKFDLIFSILKELQNRQAQLEESVRVLQTQVGATGTFGSAGSTTTDEGSVNMSNSPVSGVAGSVTSGSGNMVRMNNVMVVCPNAGMMQQMQPMPQVMQMVLVPAEAEAA
mmetsp:Transcript_20790/g.39051  ORF Transcript_20790/g.39051 Transcript_20790/m.39051 type:complete len:224 (+) Transcript_20790:79-750(+)